MFRTLSLLTLSVVSTMSSTSTSESEEDPTNILLIMMDDLGRSDLGIFGSEWETPNIDNFLSNSLLFSHHYIGYVCSASRSQFLTGRHSFENGYGTLNVFDTVRLGVLPKGVPTLPEYLKLYSNYRTYLLGKWQLGSATEDNLAVNRGFDYFYGYNGGMERYFDKKIGGSIDFYENDDIIFDESERFGYSTDQYFDKLTNVINGHSDTGEYSNKPFFIYFALQAIHFPFPKHSPAEKTTYYQNCLEKYNDKFENFGKRLEVCEAVTGVDEKLGGFLDYFENEQPELWSNTIILFTSDNGGDFTQGSCNYPLRGGKNTFFEGGQRVLAAVGGGKLPDKQRGLIYDGLVSNVDWAPTFLSFSQMIPNGDKKVSFKTLNNELDNPNPLVLDGYNLYNYIMDVSKDYVVRDHIMFHMLPNEDVEDRTISKPQKHSPVDYTFDDFDEIALLFYDDDKTLWKYLDTAASTNVVGDPNTNSLWCDATADAGNTKSDDVFYLKGSGEGVSADVYALFNIDNDMSEKVNYFDESNSNLISMESIDALKSIVREKVDYYTKYSDSGIYLYRNCFCFHSTRTEAVSMANKTGAWQPWVADWDQYVSMLITDCDMKQNSQLYDLFKVDYKPYINKYPTFKSIIDNQDEIIETDGFDDFANVVERVPVDSLERNLQVSLKHSKDHTFVESEQLLRKHLKEIDSVVAAAVVTQRSRVFDDVTSVKITAGILSVMVLIGICIIRFGLTPDTNTNGYKQIPDQ